MLIALLQYDICWENPKENLSRLDALIAQTPHADLYLLPEMFSTGFVTSVAQAAEPACGPAFQWMLSRSKYLGAAVAGSVSVVEDGKYFNRMYFVRPDGSWDCYDKRHLFGSEAADYTPGSRRVITQWKGVRFLLATCYDLRFPVWLRNRSDYDMILLGASWPSSRRYAWDTLLKARAIENQCFVAGVNRVGDDPNASYNGGSVLLNPLGEVLSGCPDSEQCSVTSFAELELVGDYRKRFPALQDADKFGLL